MDPKRRFASEYDNASNQKELTDKFLNGEITFSEYSEQWASAHLGEDDEVDEDKIEEEEETVAAAAPKKVYAKRSRRQLTPALAGLMGEANLRYARGDRAMAEKMCYEIIRQIPVASEPYHTLAQIYESDPDKSLQFSLIAAHLNPSDGEQWIRLAGISKEKGDTKQALICYTKAINANPKHLPYHNARLELVKYFEEHKSAEERKNCKITSQLCLTRMMNWYPPSEGQTVVNIAKKVAREYHAMNNIVKACEVMNRAYGRFSNLFDFENLNLYLELLITLKQYDKCLSIFVAHCGVEVETEVQIDENAMEETSNIVNCTVPDSLPIDLRTKLYICLIYLKAYHLVDDFLNDLIANENVETTGDIYLDIEEALTNEKCHERAFKLLYILIKSSRYSLPAVWLKYAECLYALKKNVDAIHAYKTVVELAPQHIDARVKLANLLIDANCLEEALNALTQNEYTEVLDTGLLYKRCNILKNMGKLEEYLNIGNLLLSRHFFIIRNRDEITAFKTRDTEEQLRIMRESRGERFEEPIEFVFEDNQQSSSSVLEWELLNDMFKTAYELKKYDFLERLAFSALGSKRFAEHRNRLEFSTMLACLYNKDYNLAFTMIRDFFVRSHRNVGVLNTFNLVIQQSFTVRHSKFLLRFFQRAGSQNAMIKMLVANCHLVAGTYRTALKHYLCIYENDETALHALLCAVATAHITCHRFTVNRHKLIVQCMAFMQQYSKMRGSAGQQEIYYNLGRMYHQFGLHHVAVQYYKLALNVPLDFDDDTDAKVFDLRREIAFNLHLIYKQTVPELAMMYLQKYVVI